MPSPVCSAMGRRYFSAFLGCAGNKTHSGAFSGTAFHGNCALVSLRDPFDHGKPQAGTLPFPGASSGIYLIKTVPYFIQLILFNADSVIGNRAGNVSAAGGKGTERMAVLPSIGDAIGNQIDKKAHHHGFISAKQDIGLDIGFQRDVSCSSKAALFFCYDFGQLTQVQDFGMELLLSAVCAGQGEELKSGWTFCGPGSLWRGCSLWFPPGWYLPGRHIRIGRG